MLLKKLKKYNLFLGSQSPRRKLLMKGAGFNFSVLPHIAINENVSEIEVDYEIAIQVAKKKAKSYDKYLQNKHSILITADTIVSINNIILGKPSNYNEASNMLQQLSGNIHYVYTGVCIKTLEKEITFYDKTEVHFRILTSEEINYYITNYTPYDKAGSYGVQEWIGYVGIKKIIGSYFNVMGLPMEKLYVELDNLIQ